MSSLANGVEENGLSDHATRLWMLVKDAAWFSIPPDVDQVDRIG